MKTNRKFKKIYGDGGDLKLPLNEFDIATGMPTAIPKTNRPLPFIPQKPQLAINDSRKISATSGKPLNQDRENITGNYDTDRIDNIVHSAKLYGVNPYQLLATDLQETNLGKDKKDKHSGYITPPGHVQMDSEDMQVKSKIQPSLPDQLNQGKISTDDYLNQLGYDDFARFAKEKNNYAKYLGINDPATQLQSYNGYGKIKPTTEQAYDGFKTSMYGVPVPATGLNMRTNPVYGRRILDYENVLMKSPDVKDAVDTVYENGGTMRALPTIPPTLGPRRFKKAYGFGGQQDPDDPSQTKALSSTPGLNTATGAGSTSMLGAGVGVANSISGSINPYGPNGHVKGGAMAAKDGLKYGAEGAEIGSVIPGVGTLIGGAVGLVGGVTAGLITAGKANRKADALDRVDANARQTYSLAQGNAAVGANPGLRYGLAGASDFAVGGTLPSGPGSDNPSKRYDPTKAPTYNPALLTNGKFMVTKADGSLGQWGNPVSPSVVNTVPIIPPPALLPSDKAAGLTQNYYPSTQQNQSKAIPTIQPSGQYGDGGSIHIKPSHEGRFTAYKQRTGKTTEEALHSSDAHVRKMATFAKNAAGWKKAFGGSIGSGQELPDSQQLPGGSTTPLNQNAVEINGQSHAQGGVQLPQAEVEGGESIANGFVFSKALGFADLHKPIARAIGKVEAKPMNPVRRNTISVLKAREAQLAMAQESLKQRMGIPSDLDQRQQ